MDKRQFLRCSGAAGTGAALLLLGGCAGMGQITVDVASFGDWPAGRTGGSYAFDRLPSQQSQPGPAQALEDAARPALARAGFSPVADGAEPELLVQIGARVSRADRSPWDDPFWWGGAPGLWRRGPWIGGPYGLRPWGGTLGYESARYDRELALLIRDRASGKPLYEARASSEGYQWSLSASLLLPLADAALLEFPAVRPETHRVTVPLTGR